MQDIRATNVADLFSPVQVGPLKLHNRVVMAPLTRSRARQPGNVPSSLAACYYAQRASAALIVSEATQISMQGQGYAWTPGIHSREQIEAWHRVTQAVHQAGGLIFNQLWHVGRISHPALQPDNMLPVAPSAIMLCSLLSYIDRQILAVLSPTILKETGMSAYDYGWVIACFASSVISLSLSVTPPR